MKLVYRYIFGVLCATTLYTLAALLGVYAFFDTLKEVSVANQGNYTLLVMAQYVALMIPSNAYELMPLAVLIGAIIAMSQLATNSEYTVIRSSGISLAQIARTLLLFGLVFAALTGLLGEILAPLTKQQAERMKLKASHLSVAQGFNSGSWVKDGKNFINIQEILPDNTLIGVYIYTYNTAYQLTHITHAERANFVKHQHLWKLYRVTQTILTDSYTKTASLSSMTWRSVIDPSLFNVLLVVPEQMSAANLLRYIRHLKANQQKSERYEVAFWGKIFYPFACLSMALVTLAFTPLERRQRQLGFRLFFGICVGISFHFINRLFGYLGVLYSWSPVLSAMLPMVLFLLAGTVLIYVQEKR